MVETMRGVYPGGVYLMRTWCIMCRWCVALRRRLCVCFSILVHRVCMPVEHATCPKCAGFAAHAVIPQTNKNRGECPRFDVCLVCSTSIVVRRIGRRVPSIRTNAYYSQCIHMEQLSRTVLMFPRHSNIRSQVARLICN